VALYEYWHVDAFSARPLHGNAAGIVFEADDLDGSMMQRIAAEMNLSETAFLMTARRPEADYRVRFFTPRSEVPFAGHPTVASSFAWREKYRPDLTSGTLLQQSESGITPVSFEKESDKPYSCLVTQLAPKVSPVDFSLQKIARSLGIAIDELGSGPAEVVSTGLPWLIVPIASVQSIEKLQPDLSLIEEMCRAVGAIGITVFAELDADSRCRIRLRTFAPGEGVREDPTCGSGNGSVAAYGAIHRYWPGDTSYIAEQGVELNRRGEIQVVIAQSADGIAVQLGGSAVAVVRGTLSL
jgi:PhzF family phenazine biosynthesis protein